jgi:hypothetical protein
MSRDDPLETWHLDPELNNMLTPQRRTLLDAQARTALDELQGFLDDPPPRGSLGDVRIGSLPDAYGLPHDQVLRAQGLYSRVVAKGGPGNTYVQENLLELIATTQDPASIPFWLDIVNLARPRDSFTTKRRTYAAASLARLAIQTDSAGAYAALGHLAQHPRADMRALAIYYLRRAYRDAGRPVPAEVVADLSATAARDSSFEPRFQARALLRDSASPVPLDNPGGLYTFKVKYRWMAGITRTIELRSEQTLWDLHQTIQRALKWYDDHLYSFFMNGQKWDRRYAFASPDDEDHPPFVDEAVIGELGLTPKHKFLYYFDYGDGHEFEIQVIGISPQVEPGDYPCVTASQGEIEQYPSWEEETDEE